MLTDFPYLAKSKTQVAKALRAAGGDWDALKADVFKVPHHCSKHGLNLELVERVKPKYTLVSSARHSAKYRFPHAVSQELIREALEPTTTSGATHASDYKLGILYTFDKDTNGDDCGTIAAVMRPTGTTIWRMGDAQTSAIDLSKARQWQP